THDAWSRGQLPVWNDDVSGGRPLMPNPNTGVLYPLRPLLSRVAFPTAMRLMPVIHWVLAGWGMLALLHALGGSRASGWVAAGTYAFSGVLVAEVFYLPLQAGAALQPWALWALVRPADPGKKALGLGLVYGLMLLAGDAIAVGLALLAAVLWILVELRGRERREPAATVAAALVLGALLAAPQLCATAGLVPETRRAVSGFSVGEALTFSFQPWRLAELVVPFVFGETWTLDPARNWGAMLAHGFFPTIFCGAFAVLAFGAAKGSRGARFCGALAAVSAALAAAGLLAPAGLRALPSPLPLRYPEKLVVGLTLALALVSGLGFDRIAASPHRAVRRAFAAAAILALLAAGAMLLPPGPARVQLPPALAEGGWIWAATSGTLWLLGRGGSARAGAAAILAVLPLAATRRVALTDRDDAVLPPTAFARALQRRDPDGRYRAVDASRYRQPSPLEHRADGAVPEGTAYYRRSWHFHTPVLWNRGTVFNADLDAGDLSRVESLRRVSAFAAADPSGSALFASVSLRYAIRYRGQAPLPGFVRFGGDAVQDWDESVDALPDVRRLSGWREAPDAVAALRLLPALGPGEVVLETGRSGSGRSAPGSLTLLEKTPERLELTTDAPEGGWLFVLRGYWRFRDVRVDGHPVEPVPAQLAFSAIPVPAGRHRIAWRERVPGAPASWVGPIGFAVIAVVVAARRRPGSA
ncbi:MAG TPA: hypothetical protein VKG23_15975, partial [Thermoanaerobaculia bacterium]|nr:hypothetical protein [Thermoanaerobaculia bacterium]